MTSLLRRRREGKTDYRARTALLLSRRPFATVRVSGKNVVVQIGRAEAQGDLVLSAAHSRELLRHGWRGSRKNLPAAYLTGLLAGYKARRNDVTEAILYTGPRRFASGGRVAAALKGLQEAGLSIPADPAVLPKPERVHGEHLAPSSAKQAEGKPTPRRRGAKLPEPSQKVDSYHQMVEQVKNAIVGEFGGTKQ